MKHWYITYEDKSGDISHVHTYARTKQDAIDDTFSEYWDCENIIECYEVQ